MSKVITIAGQKEKTGKSVTAVNLSASLALLEKKILLVDCDSQASATAWSGVFNSEDNFDLGGLFSGKKSIKEVILKTDLEYLWVMPSNINLYNIGLKLSKRAENQKVLRLFLKEIKDDFDYIIIDSPSLYGFLSITALTASDWVMTSFFAKEDFMKNLNDLLKLVKVVRRKHKIPVKFAGIILNKCSKKQRDIFLKKKDIRDVRDIIFKTTIPDDESVHKTTEKSKPSALYDIKSRATVKYLELAEELIAGFN